MAEAQRQRRGSTEQEQQRQTARQLFEQRLTTRGYTQEQARQIIDVVERMRRGQNVRLTPEQSAWANDINSVRDAWARVSPDTRRVSQLTRDDVISMFAGPLIRGPPAVPTVREVSVPAPVRLPQYTVTVNGQEYNVQLKRPLSAGRVTNLESGRVGQLGNILATNPEAVLGITRVTPSGSSAAVRPGTRDFNEFRRVYAAAYSYMRNNPESDAITVASR
jgi:hypothetical protein